MSVREINDESHFQAELQNAGIKLVIVDFTAAWCGPCRTISPLFGQLPAKFPNAVFLKVDVDKCQETAAMQGVSAMPTFNFYRNRLKIDKQTGADINGLEMKIKQHYDSDGSDTEKDYGQGLMDLSIFILKDMCEALNEADDHNLKNLFNEGFLASDCDEQIVISIQFNQAVKIHSLIMKAPADHGPKTIKLFINQPHLGSFDNYSSTIPIQEIEVAPKDLNGENMINLRFVKFQNVQNVVLFVVDNQNGSDRTVLQELKFIGAPIQTTKMDDFKRISGKKGESH